LLGVLVPLVMFLSVGRGGRRGPGPKSMAVRARSHRRAAPFVAPWLFHGSQLHSCLPGLRVLGRGITARATKLAHWSPPSYGIWFGSPVGSLVRFLPQDCSCPARLLSSLRPQRCLTRRSSGRYASAAPTVFADSNHRATGSVRGTRSAAELHVVRPPGPVTGPSKGL
jgi:hypothetical protein